MLSKGYYRSLETRRKRGTQEIPGVQDMYSLVLRILKDHGVSTTAEIRGDIADYYWLTEDEVYFTSEFGSTPVLSSRLTTTLAKLVKAALIRRVSQGTYEITKFGLQVFEAFPKLDDSVLDSIEEELRRWFDWDNEKDVDYRETPNFNPDYNINLDDMPDIKRRAPEQAIEPYFQLSSRDIRRLYSEDLRFRNILRSGFVTYKEGSLYVTIPEWNNEGGYFTWYLQEQVPEVRLCVEKNYATNTLSFKGFYEEEAVTKQNFVAYYLNIYRNTPDWTNPYDYSSRNTINYLADDIFNAKDGYDALNRYIKDNSVIRDRLGKALSINPSTLYRELNGQTKMSLRRLVEICLALKLPYKISLAFVDKFNLTSELYDGDPEHSFWDMLLSIGQVKTPDEINDMCKSAGFENIFILTDENRDAF